MTAIYTTIGSVRGCCGHAHATPVQAHDCQQIDARLAAREGA